MGKIVIKDQPCPDQTECKSSDALQVYEDGTGYCFSCLNFFNKTQIGDRVISTAANIKVDPDEVTNDDFQKLVSLKSIKDMPVRGFADRFIIKQVCEFFGVHSEHGTNGEVDTHYYPYGNEGYRVRYVDNKKFSVIGKLNSLFGQDKFNAGGKRLIITEGELDAMAIATASYKKYDKTIYPVVTMGPVTNIKLLLENRDWIRSFDQVVLWFDNDKVGQQAVDEAVKIIGIDKARVARHNTLKDANDVLIKEGVDKIFRPIFDAAKVVPAGIINTSDLRNRMISYNEKTSLPYPICLAGINSKLKGKRTGEIALFISGTGSGKSTILREDMLDTLLTIPVDQKIGVIALEESPEESARKLTGMYLNKNPSNEEIPIEELLTGFDYLFDSDRVVLLDHQGSISDNSIMDRLEYMCLSGCKYLYIDHITILVSEGVDGLTGNEAVDKMMNDLLRLVKKYDVWIGLVSHLRKSVSGGTSFEEGKLPSLDDIKGSGSIKQICFDIIAFARDMGHAEEGTRNEIKMAVLKSRFTGLTGPVPGAKYDKTTGRLTAIAWIDPDDVKEVSEDQFTKLQIKVPS